MNKVRVRKLIKDVVFMYLSTVLVLIIIKAILAIVNGEAIIENVMLNLRTYLLGSLDSDVDLIFSSRFESIGIFAIVYTFIVSLILYYALYLDYRKSDKNKMITAIVLMPISLIISIFTYKTFLFCLPEGIFISSVLYIVSYISRKMSKNSENSILNSEKFGKIIRILVCIVLVISSIIDLIPYFTP